MARGRVPPQVASGVMGAVRGIAGTNPYTAAAMSIVDIGMRLFGGKSADEAESVDASANDFSDHPVVFVAGIEQKIAHKLDREPSGFNIIQKGSDMNIWQVSSDNRHITVMSNADGRATLRVH